MCFEMQNLLPKKFGSESVKRPKIFNFRGETLAFTLQLVEL